METSVFLRRGQQVYLRYESGNGNPPSNTPNSGDCTVATHFRYAQLNILLYAATCYSNNTNVCT